MDILTPSSFKNLNFNLWNYLLVIEQISFEKRHNENNLFWERYLISKVINCYFGHTN